MKDSFDVKRNGRIPSNLKKRNPAKSMAPDSSEWYPPPPYSEPAPVISPAQEACKNRAWHHKISKDFDDLGAFWDSQDQDRSDKDDKDGEDDDEEDNDEASAEVDFPITVENPNRDQFRAERYVCAARLPKHSIQEAICEAAQNETYLLFQRKAVQLAGEGHAAALLSQLYYWVTRGKDGHMRTKHVSRSGSRGCWSPGATEITRETLLDRFSAGRAVQRLERRELIQTRRSDGQNTELWLPKQVRKQLEEDAAVQKVFLLDLAAVGSYTQALLLAHLQYLLSRKHISRGGFAWWASTKERLGLGVGLSTDQTKKALLGLKAKGLIFAERGQFAEKGKRSAAAVWMRLLPDTLQKRRSEVYAQAQERLRKLIDEADSACVQGE